MGLLQPIELGGFLVGDGYDVSVSGADDVGPRTGGTSEAANEAEPNQLTVILVGLEGDAVAEEE